MKEESRLAARGVLLAPTGRILLLCTQLDWLGRVWMVPGGGVESGESLVQAAAREVHEETGLENVPVGPELWWRDVTIVLPERTLQLREHYFLVRVSEFEPTLDGFQDYERASHLGHGWWGAPEMLSAPDTFAPPELAGLLQDLVESGPGPSRRIESRTHNA